MNKIPVLPYLESSEDLDSIIQDVQAPDFIAKSLLKSKIFGTLKKIAHFSNLILSKIAKIWVKFAFFPI